MGTSAEWGRAAARLGQCLSYTRASPRLPTPFTHLGGLYLFYPLAQHFPGKGWRWACVE